MSPVAPKYCLISVDGSSQFDRCSDRDPSTQLANTSEDCARFPVLLAHQHVVDPSVPAVSTKLARRCEKVTAPSKTIEIDPILDLLAVGAAVRNRHRWREVLAVEVLISSFPGYSRGRLKRN
jgi:hypothetical protein